MATYSTASTSLTLNGVALTAGSSPEPAKAPKGLIVTRAVETKGGWVGQLIVDEEIIWESTPQDAGETAERLATARVVARIKKLLGLIGMKGFTNTVTAVNLRAAADLLEAHPELVQPYVTTNSNGTVNLNWYLTVGARDLASQKLEAARIVTALDGEWEKGGSEKDFNFRQGRGGLSLLVQVDRPAVCERIVTGTEAVTIPAKEAVPEQVIERELVEWRCQPLLLEVSR